MCQLQVTFSEHQRYDGALMFKRFTFCFYPPQTLCKVSHTIQYTRHYRSSQSTENKCKQLADVVGQHRSGKVTRLPPRWRTLVWTLPAEGSWCHGDHRQHHCRHDQRDLGQSRSCYIWSREKRTVNTWLSLDFLRMGLRNAMLCWRGFPWNRECLYHHHRHLMHLIPNLKTHPLSVRLLGLSKMINTE